jgi:hypothetical protein
MRGSWRSELLATLSHGRRATPLLFRVYTNRQGSPQATHSGGRVT